MDPRRIEPRLCGYPTTSEGRAGLAGLDWIGSGKGPTNALTSLRASRECALTATTGVTVATTRKLPDLRPLHSTTQSPLGSQGMLLSSATPAASPLQDSPWQLDGGGDPLERIRGRPCGRLVVARMGYHRRHFLSSMYCVLCTTRPVRSKDRRYELKASRTGVRPRGRAAIETSSLPQCALSV